MTDEHRPVPTVWTDLASAASLIGVAIALLAANAGFGVLMLVILIVSVLSGLFALVASKR